MSESNGNHEFIRDIPLSSGWTFAFLPEDAPESLPEGFPSALSGEAVSLPHVFSRDGRPCRGRGVYSRAVPGDPSAEN